VSWQLQLVTTLQALASGDVRSTGGRSNCGFRSAEGT
jgi:hypothetical protein